MNQQKSNETSQINEQEVVDSNAQMVSDLKHVQKGFAGHLHLYLIMSGFLMGFLAGPWGLKRIDPVVYEKLFMGRPWQQNVSTPLSVSLDPWSEIRKQAEKIGRLQLEHDEKRERLKDTDSALAAFETEAAEAMEIEQALLMDLQRIKERHVEAHKLKLNIIMMGLFIAGLFIMSLEALVSHDAPENWDQWRGRLILIRFAIFSILLAMIIARPEFSMAGLLTWVTVLTGGLGLMLSQPWRLNAK